MKEKREEGKVEKKVYQKPVLTFRGNLKDAAFEPNGSGYES